MLVDALSEAWAERRRSSAIDPVMRFADEGLVFGAGTVLAKSGAADREISIDPGEPRLVALLVAAHLNRPTADALAHLRKAAQRWSEGDKALAAMHLTLSRLDRLERPESDAHRLFLADELLEAGVEANTIVEAILAGDPAFKRLQKYDPDQPRVPAGSGRTSGQWTSTGDASPGATTSETGDSTPNLLQPLELQPQVNPATVTEVAQRPIESNRACDLAKADCVDAAVYASRNDAANDNARFLDLDNCKKARAACDTMSWVIEDIPFIADTGEGGGVIFPHGGVVVITKGRTDRYFPPLSGGRPPLIRRSSAADEHYQDNEGLKVEGHLCPPWSAAPDETFVPTTPVPNGFSGCRKLLGLLTAKMDATVTERECWLSGQWGKIIRAQIAYSFKGSPATARVTCWSAPNLRTGIFMRLDSCCGS